MDSDRFGLCCRTDPIKEAMSRSICQTEPNKTVQATPTNAAVLPLRSRVVLCYRYGVPDLFRWAS
jgi:hypothetical protein